MDVFDGSVVNIDDGVGQVRFEFLDTHDFFFKRVLGDESVHVKDSLLADPVCSIDCLHVDCRIVVTIEHDDTVGRGQIQSNSSNGFSHQQDLDIAVSVEGLRDCEAISLSHIGSQLQVVNCFVIFLEVTLDQVNCVFLLREDQYLNKGNNYLVMLQSVLLREPKLLKQLSQCNKLPRIIKIALTLQISKVGMVDDLDHLMEVTQSIDLPSLTLHFYPLLQVLVMLQLTVRERAVVIIDDLLRKLPEDVAFHPPHDEGHHLEVQFL